MSPDRTEPEETEAQLADAEAEVDEIVDDAADDPMVPAVRYDISSYGIDFDVKGLVTRLAEDKVLIPRFQRSFVWNLPDASRFVESLLLGLPVPGIFLAKDPETNKMLVIDGQQRLRSLQFFCEGYFNPDPARRTRRALESPHHQGAVKGRMSMDREHQSPAALLRPCRSPVHCGYVVVLALTAASMMISSPLAAQSAVRGRVIDTTATPIELVQVVRGHGVVLTHTQKNGTFFAFLTPPGPHLLVFRKLGFRPLEVSLTAAPADTAVVEVVLVPEATRLEDIAVSAPAPPSVSPKREAFNSRRDASRQGRNGGTFIDELALRKQEHSPISQILRSVPGLRIMGLRGGGAAVATTRGQAMTLTRAQQPCYAQVFVDGALVWSLRDLLTQGPFNIDDLGVVALQGIEVYKGSASTPSEFSGTGSDCGSIVLWTR